MTDARQSLPYLLWATRGHQWGHRFLLNGGHADPIGVYDAAFDGEVDQPEVLVRTSDWIAVRFADPDARRDASGRIILHELVVPAAMTAIGTVDDARRVLWPMLADAYDDVFALSRPPTVPITIPVG